MATTNTPKTVDEMIGRGFEAFTGTLEQRVQELADREEIRDLITRYAQRVSRRQSPADLFAEDGAMVVRMPGLPVQEVRGRPQLEAFFSATVTRPAANLPAVHNEVISVHGDEALATSWIELHVSDDNDPDGRAFAGSGHYDDRLRREGGRWKFASREAHVLVVGAVQKANPITRN